MSVPGEIDVLHVDDEPNFVGVAADMLEREDSRFSVETATSASAGLDRLAGDDFDCIVSDYQMPGQNGIDFLETIRDKYPDLPFILFTGKGSEEVASDAISAGATDYLQKGPTTDQYELLATRIMTAVGQYHAERELERQNDLFAKSQDLANVGAWEYDPQEQETHFTDMVYEIYGVGPEYDPTPEQDIKEFYHPDDRDTVRTAVEEALQSGKEYDIEVRITAADGTDKWIRTRGTPQVEDGTVQCVRGTIQDITERKERERKLRRQNERLEMALEEAQAGLWEWDIDTDALYWSDEVLDMLGLSADAFDGDINTFEQRLHPGDVDRVETAIETAIETGEHYQVEQRIKQSDGEYLWLDVRGQVVKDDESQSMIGIVFDITERKEQEEQLRRQRDHLDELTRTLSHDLRNPLQVADSRLELAQEECTSDHLETAGVALERANALITDVLSLTQDGETATGISRVVLSTLIENCWHTVDTADATLVDDVDRAVRADQSRLRQLFENVIRDAIEHGGSDVTVTVGELEDGFYIEDDGPGIPPEERDAVFDVGYSTSEEGTGFGLSIVKRVVEAHDWEIRLTEGSNGGARFEVTGVEFAAE